MRNIIWCISTGYEHMLSGPHASHRHYVIPTPTALLTGEESKYDVYFWKGQSAGISSAIMPPYAFIPKNTSKAQLIHTTPSTPTP